MNKKNFRLMSIFITFVLMLGNSYNVGAASAYGEQFSQSKVAAALPAFPEMEGSGANILDGQGGTAHEITITNGSSSVSQASHAENPILINALTRPMKYYGVDRGSPYTDTNYATLAQHAVKTIIVDTFINDANNSSSAKWSHIKALAAQYNFNYVIWPNQGGDVPGCGWETPFNSPQNGDYIWRVTTMLDSFTTDPHFIGMISAHEPMWNTSTCKTSISDMASIKTQLKNYMQTKGRNDFKVWNYIDNVSDLKNMPGFVSADIERVMDVAVTWQHCFGGAEGTCAGAKNKIIADRALIDNAGLNGKVDLVYLFQTFATSGGYSMPTLTDMQTWDCQFIATNALDGFMYYTWGAWYSTDLRNHPELWPEMNRVYDSCINQAPDTSAPAVLSSVRDNVNPTSAISVDFTVTFSESVTGVTADDFFSTTSGVSGVAVSGVSGSSGSVYIVTVSTGNGPGTIRLDVADDNSIVDVASNPLGGAGVGDGNFTSGETYSIVRTTSFWDVSTSHWAWKWIESFYQQGITTGCAQTPVKSYCPENNVTRAEMAVFMERVLHGSSYQPPMVPLTFNDISGHWAQYWIERSNAEGITTGCGGGKYCPDQNVTRAEMSVFILRALHGGSYQPPVVGLTFNDTTEHWAQYWIEQFKTEGITTGCGGGKYCPDQNVTRAEMAVFIVRAFGYPVLP